MAEPQQSEEFLSGALTAQQKVDLLEQRLSNAETKQEVYRQVTATIEAQEQKNLEEEAGVGFWGGTKDVLIDAPIRGAVNSVTEFGIAYLDFASAYAKYEAMSNPHIQKQYLDSGLTQADLEADAAQASEDFSKVNDVIRGTVQDFTPDVDTTGGKVVEGITQFALPFMKIVKPLRTVNALRGSLSNRVLQDTVASAIVSSTFFNPNDPNLANFASNFVDKESPAYEHVLQYLEADPDDPDALNRLRNGTVDMIIGPFFDLFIEGIRLGKATLVRRWESKLDEAAEASNAINLREGAEEGTGSGASKAEEADADGVAVKPEGESAEGGLKFRRAGKSDEAAPARDGDEPEPPKSPEREPEGDRMNPRSPDEPAANRTADWEQQRSNRRHTTRTIVQESISSVDKQKLIDVVMNGGKGAEKLSLDIFNWEKIDTDSFENPDDLEQFLAGFQDVVADILSDMPRDGVQTEEMTRRIAESIGFSAEEVAKYAADTAANGGLAARAFAAQQALVSSAKRTMKLIEDAKKDGGNAEKQVRAHQAIELHAGLMAQVKRGQREVARALNAHKYMRDAAGESFDEFNQIIRTIGKHGDSKRVFDDILSNTDNLAAFNLRIKRTAGRRASDIAMEVALMGLLSSPATQVVNLASNAVMPVLHAVEDTLASAIGKGRTMLGMGQAERIYLRQAGYKWTGMASKFWLATINAAKAAARGEPITDFKAKAEISTRKAIEADAVSDLTNGVVVVPNDSWLGKTINVVGEINRLPGRALVTGDEFFKTILKHSELEALAYSKARTEADMLGLTGKKRRKYIKKWQKRHYEEPTIEMEQDAIDMARRGTFQEVPQTGFGAQVERMLNYSPIVKLLISPFVRTPLNILRQGFVERTPLAIATRKWRQDIAKGGIEGDRAIARMTIGTGMVLSAYALTDPDNSGPDKYFEVVGKQDYRMSGRIEGVPDYSIRIGEKWYQFNRFDPLGSWLGFAADVRHVMAARDPHDPTSEGEVENFLKASLYGFMNNSLNKVFLKSFYDLIETTKVLMDGNANAAERAGDKFIADQLLKLTPFSSLQRGISNEGGLEQVAKKAVNRITDTAWRVEAFDVSDPDLVNREAWEWQERLGNVIVFGIPGIDLIPDRKDLAVRRDYLGREVTPEYNENYLINPFRAKPDSDDPLEVELSLLSFTMDPLDKTLGNGKVPLTAQQYSDYKYFIGQKRYPGLGNKNLEEYLREYIESPEYKEMPTDALRGEAIKEIWGGVKNGVAKRELLRKYPDLFTDEVVYDRYELSQRLGQDLSATQQELEALRKFISQ